MPVHFPVRTVSLLLGIVLLAALPLRAADTLAPHGASWRDDLAYLDLVWNAPEVLDPGIAGEVRLDPPFRRDGARYDLLMVGPEPGELFLTALSALSGEEGENGLAIRSSPPAPPLAGLHLQILDGVRPGPGARIQVRGGETDGIVVVRWIGYVDAAGSQATFEALLEPGGMIRVQYLQVPHAFRLPGASMHGPKMSVFAGPGAVPDLVLEPALDGFRAAPGAVAAFPPAQGPQERDATFPAAFGCGEDEPWCDVAERHHPDCIFGTRTGGTICPTTRSNQWHFNELHWCMSCPYTFYIVVECGTEMHLPFFDTEGMDLRITDVITGVQLELEAINRCARDPFLYCNNCEIDPRVYISPEWDPLCQRGAPLIDCEPYLQTSNHIQWGAPLADADGDTVGDSLPCGPSNNDACPVGVSGSQPAHEGQETAIVLFGKPGLCGVFRLDIISGGYLWDLYSNCTGDAEPVFDIYSQCDLALADFDPLPELVITDFRYSGVCPDISLEVEVTNIGCADSPSSPLRIDFTDPSQPDIEVDLGPVPVSASVISSVPIVLANPPLEATAHVDSADLLFECSEDGAGGATFCIPETGGNDVSARILCECTSNPRAVLTEERVVSCGGEGVLVDASPSSSGPCGGGDLVYRFLDRDAAVLQDWSTAATLPVTPSLCPSLFDYTLEVGCSTELLPECVDSLPFQVECAPEAVVDITASATDVCGGTPIHLTASGGFASYTWSTGEKTQGIVVSPRTTTNYSVEAVTAKGCSASAEAEVRVRPNLIPPPLGNVLRVSRTGPDLADLAFDFPPLAGAFGPYDLVGLLPRPCPSPPSPRPTPFIFSGGPILDSGLPPLVHGGGATGCPDLVFYKVRGTSECDGTRGALCDGFPAQALECP